MQLDILRNQIYRIDYSFNQMDSEKSPPVTLEEKKPETAIIYCQKCKKPNDVFNDVCVYCFQFFDEENLLICHVCGKGIDSNEYPKHLATCEIQMKKLIPKYSCRYCKAYVDSTQYFEHQKKCLKAKESAPLTLPSKSTADEKDEKVEKIPFSIEEQLKPSEIQKLTPLQLEAITYMHQSSIKYHYDAKQAFTSKMKELGFGQDQINKMRIYVQKKAPVIIHVNFKKYIPYFISDTHYRNLFQTNTTSGSSDKNFRMTKQNKMFKNVYYYAQNYERVKYGVLNLKNDRKGVACCQNYGKSFFVLRNKARGRCTITNKNSSTSTSIDQIGTLKHCFHVLNTLPNQQLKDTMRAALGDEQSNYNAPQYKEVQIHGPVQFLKDISEICIDKSEIETDDENFQMILAFIQKHDIKYSFF